MNGTSLLQSLESLDIGKRKQNNSSYSLKNLTLDNIQGVVPTVAAEASRYVWPVLILTNVACSCSFNRPF